MTLAASSGSIARNPSRTPLGVAGVTSWFAASRAGGRLVIPATPSARSPRGRGRTAHPKHPRGRRRSHRQDDPIGLAFQNWFAAGPGHAMRGGVGPPCPRHTCEVGSVPVEGTAAGPAASFSGPNGRAGPLFHQSGGVVMTACTHELGRTSDRRSGGQPATPPRTRRLDAASASLIEPGRRSGPSAQRGRNSGPRRMH